MDVPTIKSVKEILEEQKPEIDLLINKSIPQPTGKGGKRIGSGRPKGAKGKTTIEKEAGEKEIERRVLNGIASLINSQWNIASGSQFLYKLETKRWKSKNGQWKEEKKPPKLITDQFEIEAYLNGDYEDDKDVYYFITTHKPDNKAIESLLDRVFGKAKQSIDLKGSLTLEDVMKENWKKRQAKIESMTDDEFIKYNKTNNIPD